MIDDAVTRIDWSQAPVNADGWGRSHGRSFWWRKPRADELAPVRIVEAPDFAPDDSHEHMHQPRPPTRA